MPIGMPHRTPQPTIHRRPALIVLLALCALAHGCSRLLGTSGDRKAAAIPQYPDGAAGLTALFQDVLQAARRDDRERVHDLFASTMMTDSELTSVLGAAAPGLKARYRTMMETLANRGAVELVAQIYERKYDAVEVVAIDPASKDASDADRATAKMFVRPLALYAARIKKAGEKLGLRYDLFFYLDGHWRTANKLGEVLAKDDKRPAPAKSP
jgi:hypothetical protein